MANNVVLKRYLPLLVVIILGIVLIHSVVKKGNKSGPRKLKPKHEVEVIDAELITDTASVKHSHGASASKVKHAKKGHPTTQPSLEATTDFLAGLPDVSTIPSEKEAEKAAPKPTKTEKNKLENPSDDTTGNKQVLDAVKDTLTKLMNTDDTAQAAAANAASLPSAATKDNQPTKASATNTKATDSLPKGQSKTVPNSQKLSSTNAVKTTPPAVQATPSTPEKSKPAAASAPVVIATVPLMTADGRITIDARLPGVNTTIQTLELTASHAQDLNLTKFNVFKLDSLAPFIHNDDKKWFCNKDDTCYQNWLDMKFPPNAVWDKQYKTPCYTDYMTGRFRCIPHIYLVGWAKSGTTDLWWFWNQHPQLIHSFYKETQFLTQFSFWPDHKKMKKFDDVMTHFFDERSEEKQKPHPEQIMYDCTATIIYDNWHWRIKQGYQGDPDVPKFTNFHYLRKLHSGAQIVVLMRNPTTRALSFYNHGIDMSIKKNANLQFVYKDMPKSPIDIHKFFVDSIYYFEECVKAHSLRACCHLSGWESQDWGNPEYFMTLRIGIYYVFLEEIYKNYPADQVHLIKSEDYYSDQNATLNSLFTFMNITTAYTERLIARKGGNIMMNIKKYYTPLPETYRLLQQFYAPYNQRLGEMLNDNRWYTWEQEIDDKIEQLKNKQDNDPPEQTINV